MKSIIRCIVLFYYCNGFSQIINIPDINFKNQLLLASTTYGIAYDCAIGGYYKIDANDDGEIEVSEAQAVCVLIVPTQNINDLTGIEYFTNLTGLNFGQNNIYNIDLSQLTYLQGLICTQNNLTSLDISLNTNLVGLSCDYNEISLLNFSNNLQLLRVNCSNNLLNSLDFRNNPLFNDLGCKNNSNLTSIKIKNGATQLLGTQSIYNQCWTGCPNLTNICADDNEIPALQSYLTGCGINTSGININSDCVLSNDEFANQSVKVFPNPVERVLTLDLTSSNARFKKVIVYSILGEKVFEHQLFPLSINEMDVSMLPTGMYIVQLENEYQKEYVKIIKN